jgi:hypothetical protein
MQILARARIIVASGEVAPPESMRALSAKMLTISAAEHPAAASIKDIVETARLLAPRPAARDLNTIGEHEAITASPQKIKASTPVAKLLYLEAVGTILAHRQGVMEDPSKRCTYETLLRAQNTALSFSDSTSSRTSDDSNELGVCRPLLPEQVKIREMIEADSALFMILQLPGYQAGFPAANRNTTLVDPATEFVALAGGTYGTTSEAVASEEAGHNTCQQATVFACQVSFAPCVCVRASVCVCVCVCTCSGLFFAYYVVTDGFYSCYCQKGIMMNSAEPNQHKRFGILQADALQSGVVWR